MFHHTTSPIIQKVTLFWYRKIREFYFDSGT